MEDREMIRRIQDGEAEVFRELVLKYYDEVFRYCYYKTGDEQASYDCTQDTFLHLTKYIGTYVDKRKFKAYLFTIARNACYDYYRNNQAVLPLIYEGEEDGAGSGKEGACISEGMKTMVEDKAIGNVETKEMLRTALGRLPDMQREAVVLRFIHDFKLKDIASLTGVPLPTVKSRLRQGLSKLKLMLERM